MRRSRRTAPVPIHLQVQGLLDVLHISGLEFSSSHDCLHITRDQQEARAAEQLRQQAGPTAIIQVEQLLIQRAYGVKPDQSAHRTVLIPREEQIPRQLPHEPCRPSTLWCFICEYIHVIKRNFQVLGYRITIKNRDITNGLSDGIVDLHASLSGPGEALFDAITTDTGDNRLGISVHKV